MGAEAKKVADFYLNCACFVLNLLSIGYMTILTSFWVVHLRVFLVASSLIFHANARLSAFISLVEVTEPIWEISPNFVIYFA